MADLQWIGMADALIQLPAGMMILSALIALPLTIAASQMFGCILLAGF